MNCTKRQSSWISSLFVRRSKVEQGASQQAENEKATSLSKIQTLPVELKLQILETAANVLEVKNLVIACPSFYPVYCENRYRILLNAHRASQDIRTDVLVEIVLNIHKFVGSARMKKAHARQLWTEDLEDYYSRDRVSFADSQPSLTDLIEVSRMDCWVVEKAGCVVRMTMTSEIALDARGYHCLLQNAYTYLYSIEIFAAMIGDTDRGWAAASMPQSSSEDAVQCLWSDYSLDRMSEIVKVIWPNRFGKTPPCRRRTRVLILRNVRQRRHGTVYSS